MVAVGAETPCIWNHERWWITHLRSTQKVAKSSPKVSAFWMPRRRPGRKCHCQRGVGSVEFVEFVVVGAIRILFGVLGIGWLGEKLRATMVFTSSPANPRGVR